MNADEVLRLKQVTELAGAFKDKELSKSWNLWKKKKKTLGEAQGKEQDAKHNEEMLKALQ